MAANNDFDYSGLVQYLDEKFTGLSGRMERLEGMFRDLRGGVDTYAKRADAFFQEVVMLTHRVERH